MLGDALDLPSSLKLHGNEFLVVSIDKPSLNKPITKTFRIYRIGERSLGANGLQNYTVYFCSEEFFISTQMLVSKSYKGLRIDQMVQDLLGKMKVQTGKVNVLEQTAGNFDIIIPRMNPLEAISWLVPRAYNNNKNLFFFFENRDGYNFVSYESLIQIPVYDTYTFSVKLDQDPVKNSNTFNLLSVSEDFNTIKAMRSGAFSSSLVTYDVISRSYSTLNFSCTTLANNAVLNSNLPANEFKNRMGQSMYSPIDNMLKFAVINDADPTRNPAKLEKWIPQTASRLGQLNTFKIVGVIPGDILVKAGMVVGLVMPLMEIQEKATTTDNMRSGRYIVSSVHHKFIQTISSTIVELLSDTVNAPMYQAVIGSPTIAQVIAQ
jgi:citrate lyase gamma subunit